MLVCVALPRTFIPTHPHIPTYIHTATHTQSCHVLCTLHHNPCTDDLVATSAKSSEEAAAAAAAVLGSGGAPAPVKITYADSTLDALTEGLMGLIFDENVAKRAMADMNLDPV